MESRPSYCLECFAWTSYVYVKGRRQLPKIRQVTTNGEKLLMEATNRQTQGGLPAGTHIEILFYSPFCICATFFAISLTICSRHFSA